MDPAALEWLDDKERSRATRFMRGVDAQRFVAAHVMLRLVLSRCLGIAPALLRFTPGTHGKPMLRDAESDVRFNLSHAGDRAVLAIAMGREVGIDIERERTMDVMELADRFFAAGERRALAAFVDHQRLTAFYRCWARKESFIKARGDGLSFPLNGFEVSMTEHSELIACRAAPFELWRWTMASLPVDEGYAAALTVEGRGWQPILWRSAVPAPLDLARAGDTAAESDRRSLLAVVPRGRRLVTFGRRSRSPLSRHDVRLSRWRNGRADRRGAVIGSSAIRGGRIGTVDHQRGH
jgi:4'-phosphopantetheinyl transferase